MTSQETRRTFLGMNIVGDRNSGRETLPQRPASELAPLFAAVFAGGVIVGTRWSQYTPYFNDGDPCEFSANGDALMIRLADRQLSAEEAEDMESGAGSGDADDFTAGWIETDSYSTESPMATLIGQKTYPADRNGRRDYSSPTWEGPRIDLAQAVDALGTALGGGEFNDALLELFGDHATVTVPASGDIEVETYEHE